MLRRAVFFDFAARYLWLRILNQSGRDNQIKIITMKKFIPILSLAIGSVCLQNCINRDEDIESDYRVSPEVQKTMMMRQDSAKSIEGTIDPNPPDPPVRDGDNWRLYKNN